VADAKVEEDDLKQAAEAKAKAKVEQDALKEAKSKAQEEEGAMKQAKTKAWDEKMVPAKQKEAADEARELQEAKEAAEAMKTRQAKEQQEATQEVDKEKAKTKNLLGLMALHPAKRSASLPQTRRCLTSDSAITDI